MNVAPIDRPVVLVGPPAVGKTRTGRALASRLLAPFVDTDDLVARELGAVARKLSPRELWELAANEEEFRAAERKVIAELAADPQPVVVAVGSGAVEDPRNRDAIASLGPVFRLGARKATLSRRARSDDRPTIRGRSPVEHAVDSAFSRRFAFEAVADELVFTEYPPLEIAETIAGRLAGFPENKLEVHTRGLVDLERALGPALERSPDFRTRAEVAADALLSVLPPDVRTEARLGLPFELLRPVYRRDNGRDIYVVVELHDAPARRETGRIYRRLRVGVAHRDKYLTIFARDPVAGGNVGETFDVDTVVCTGAARLGWNVP